MKIEKGRTERMEERTKILESYGFISYHEDNKVAVCINRNLDKHIVLDFSAIAVKYFLLHAIQEAYREGKADGEKITQNKIKYALGIKEEE